MSKQMLSITQTYHIYEDSNYVNQV